MTDDALVDATAIVVRDRGLAAAERDLQRRFRRSDGPQQWRALAALAALRKGEVGGDL